MRRTSREPIPMHSRHVVGLIWTLSLLPFARHAKQLVPIELTAAVESFESVDWLADQTAKPDRAYRSDTGTDPMLRWNTSADCPGDGADSQRISNEISLVELFPWASDKVILTR